MKQSCIIVIVITAGLSGCAFVTPPKTNPNRELAKEIERHQPTGTLTETDLRKVLDGGVRFSFHPVYVDEKDFSFGAIAEDIHRVLNPLHGYSRYVAPVPDRHTADFLRSTSQEDLSRAARGIREPQYQTRLHLLSLVARGGLLYSGEERFLKADGTSELSWVEIESRCRKM